MKVQESPEPRAFLLLTQGISFTILTNQAVLPSTDKAPLFPFRMFDPLIVPVAPVIANVGAEIPAIAADSGFAITMAGQSLSVLVFDTRDGGNVRFDVLHMGFLHLI